MAKKRRIVVILITGGRVVDVTNPTHHEFGSGWVEIFLQISVWIHF